MSYQALTRGGKPWQQLFLLSINAHDCIGCGRCFKVCGFDVLDLKAMTEDGDIVDLDSDEEIEKKVMTIGNADNCVGCGACARVCGKNVQTHGAAEITVSV
jgi:Nif-specific ferredoxin III